MLTNSNFYIGDSSISRLYQGDNLVWDSSHPDILLEYIANGPDSDSKSTKNVYFDTTVIADANTRCEMKTAIPAYKGQWFCGGCKSGFVGLEMGVSAYKRPYTRIGSYLENGQTSYTKEIQLNVPYTTVLYHNGTNQITVFDSETVTTTSGNVNAGSFSSTQGVILFGRGLDGTIYTNVSYSGMKIYYTKLWSGNNLIRFYIPVLHWNNGQYVPCFYDKVNDTYIYNLGTDTPTYKISGGLLA